MTFLFDKAVFGPVFSRRLGISLGMNLLPISHKICTFDCLYCECGALLKDAKRSSSLPSRQQIADELRSKLMEMKAENKLPNTITFAGNGEPTVHPDFRDIISDTLALRNEFAPEAKVAVLSNATQLHNDAVVEALNAVDQCILKIDSGNDDLIQQLNQPNCTYSLEKTIDNISKIENNLIIQTMFVRWMKDNVEYNNADEENVRQWLKVIERIRPPKVMIYTIDRDTPLQTMWKISKERLDEIAHLTEQIVPQVGISY